MINSHMLAAIAANPDDDIPRLAYADWLEENGDQFDRDRAELIRVQCEDARDPELQKDHTDYHDWLHRHVVRLRRECELIDAHPDWTNWEKRTSYSNWLSGLEYSENILSRRTITWDRGWPGWVHVERMSELVNLNQWGHEQHYREPTPTPLLTALAQTPPWGVPLRGVIVEELEPHIWHGPTSWGWLLSSVHSGPSTIPDAVFYHIQGGNTQDTKQVAIRAAAAAFLEFGRRYNKAAQRDGTGEAEEFLTYP